MSTIKKSFEEQAPSDFDASDVSDIEFFADAGLRERMSRLTIGKSKLLTHFHASVFLLLFVFPLTAEQLKCTSRIFCPLLEERIRYLEGVRKHLKSRREAEVFTQGIIIVVVFVILAFLLYYSS